MNIFVAGLPYDLDDAELEEIFENLALLVLRKFLLTGKQAKAVDLVLLPCPIVKEGKEAIELLNDISLGKKPLVVKEAEERPSNSNFKKRRTRWW
jgi:RNA recognition motif-containing protein